MDKQDLRVVSSKFFIFLNRSQNASGIGQPARSGVSTASGSQRAWPRCIPEPSGHGEFCPPAATARNAHHKATQGYHTFKACTAPACLACSAHPGEAGCGAAGGALAPRQVFLETASWPRQPVQRTRTTPVGRARALPLGVWSFVTGATCDFAVRSFRDETGPPLTTSPAGTGQQGRRGVHALSPQRRAPLSN